MKLHINRNISFAGRFALIQLPEMYFLGSPDPLDCKSFPLNRGFCGAQVPFKTGFTIFGKIKFAL
jgi:hypothetical protein